MPCDRVAALPVSEMSIPNMVTPLRNTKLLQDTHTGHLPLNCHCGMYGYKIPE